ncbi:MAG: hypothetical protein Q4E13_05580 [Clostridia bacterium]|nr:hypothetical protein [Clostridia bacterium]
MNGFIIFLQIVGLLKNAVSRTLGGIFDLIRDGSISLSNRASRRVVHQRKPESEAEILSVTIPTDKVMMTGGVHQSPVRNRMLAQLVRQTQQQHCPVLVLHRGNSGLEKLIKQIPGSVIVNIANPVYDPFRDLTPEEIKRLATANIPKDKNYQISADGRGYLLGIAQFYRDCLNRSPSLNALRDSTDSLSKGYLRLVNETQNFFSRGQLTQAQMDGIHGLLNKGQNEENRLNDYLTEMQDQLKSCVPDRNRKMKESDYVTIRRVAARYGVLCMDVSSVTDAEIGYNLIFNELEMMKRNNVSCPYLVLDGIQVKAVPMLVKMATDENSLPYCISCQNTQSTLSDGKQGNPLFTELADNCGLHITLLQQSGGADLWSAYYGTFQKMKRDVGYNSGSSTGHGGQLFSGYSRGSMVHYTDMDERLWRMDTFTKMREGDMIVAFRDMKSIKYRETSLRI